MSILMMYLVRAIDKGYIDEIHLWECCRNDDDRAWVNSLAADKIKVQSAKNYDEIYAHYTNSDDLFFKVDDDVVYLQIEAIPDMFDVFSQVDNSIMFMSPVCINNPTHQNLTNIPAMLGHGCNTVVDVMADVNHLKQVHKLFTQRFDLVRPTAYSIMVNTPYQPNGVRNPKGCQKSIGCVWGAEYQGYIPINTIFFNKNLCRYLTDNGGGNIDEVRLNHPNLPEGFKNLVFPCIFGSHLSYGGQEKLLADTDLQEILKDYKNLAIKINEVA